MFNEVMKAYVDGADEINGYPLLRQQSGTITQKHEYAKQHARTIERLHKEGVSWEEHCENVRNQYK